MKDLKKIDVSYETAHRAGIVIGSEWEMEVDKEELHLSKHEFMPKYLCFCLAGFKEVWGKQFRLSLLESVVYDVFGIYLISFDVELPYNHTKDVLVANKIRDYYTNIEGKFSLTPASLVDKVSGEVYNFIKAYLGEVNVRV